MITGTLTNVILLYYLDNIGICMHDLYALLLECGYNEIYGYYPSSNYISGKIMDYINGHLVNNIDFSELKRIKIEEIITNLLKENNNKNIHIFLHIFYRYLNSLSTLLYFLFCLIIYTSFLGFWEVWK